jgi:hypothetical protein
MPITTVSIGANTRQVNVSNEQSSVNIITAVDAAIVQGGWTRHDTFASADGGSQRTHVYRAINADGVTFKHFIVRWDTINLMIYTATCEFWNTSTKTATNECFTNGGRMLGSGYALSNTSIIVMSSLRWAVLYPFVRNEPSMWQGVFEFQREASEDTAALGTPCFAWTCSLWPGQNYSAVAQVSDAYSFAFPRTRNGFTGYQAANCWSLNTPFGTFPPHYLPEPGNALNGVQQKLGSLNGVYQWDTAKRPLYTIKPIMNGTFAGMMSFGQPFGLKAMPAIGEIMDQVAVPVDANNFYSPSGVSTNHWVLPMNGGNANSAATNSGVSARLAGGNGLALTSFATGFTGKIFDTVLVNGIFAYSATGAGVVKTDIATGTSVMILGTSALNCSSVAYDGGAYVYAATNLGVLRIAVLDDSSVSHAIAGGASSLCLDGTFLYAGHRTLSRTPGLEILSLATFTLSRTVIAPIFGAVAGFAALAVDFNGNVFCASTTSSSGVPGDHRLTKIVGATGVLSSVLVHNNMMSASNSCGVIFDGTEIIVVSYGSGIPAISAWSPSTMTSGSFAPRTPHRNTSQGFLPAVLSRANLASFRGQLTIFIMNEQIANFEIPLNHLSAGPFLTNTAQSNVSPLPSPGGAILASSVRVFGAHAFIGNGTNLVVVTSMFSKYSASGEASAQLLMSI